ncbi:hypothetical protein ACJMK2_040342 [Sinanodonta woodiana]|uniref:Uncharacterized protein n=1 Tax=Sinanodonta woodiana TaxID=1069815 RepID=A0ABD3WFW9_SINWO
MSARFVFVAWILLRMLSTVYTQDKLQRTAEDGDLLLTDSSGLISEFQHEDVKSGYPYFSNYIQAYANTHIPNSKFGNRGVLPIILKSNSKTTHLSKLSSGKQHLYPSSPDRNYVFNGSDAQYEAKRSRMECDITKMTIQNIIEYLRRRRVCGIKASQLRFGTGGRK